ncbi:serine carboxypeptidase [Phanerochaete sordida]|uniref:Serine carboxypeptidase n=1 Tax=Phanerochaete sordida TaxID=48140 RepID=A0A9P3LLZ1_9APHY|nr:serine carboxypeptidase [Phanerochaete sordida]
MEPFLSSGINPYDKSKRCDGSEACYENMNFVSHYLDKPEVRKILGVDPSFGNFSWRSIEIGQAFDASLDEVFPTSYYVSALLERGVRVLLYVGANDWICNWVGNEQMSRDLEWTGQTAFAGEPLREWKVDGKVAGITRATQGFTFATVDGAGHMVPMDQPKVALELVQRWLSGEAL